MDYGLRFVGFLLNSLRIVLAPLYLLFETLQKSRRVPAISDSLLLIPVKELAAKIRAQEVKSEEVVRAYINRIKLVNPIVNAVIEDRFIDAIEDARRADALCAKSSSTELKEKYPLLGVPFTVKESVGLKGFTQSVGSIPRKGLKAPVDGDTVVHLKSAGAIPLLISANPEFCVSWECNSLLNGTCCNPYNSKRSSGGSSGGEGALIGAGASLFGIGSDIAGSIRVPALFNGIFGHKPTGELLSTIGHFPRSTDAQFVYYLQTGPMCRYASDMGLLLKIMAGDKAKSLDWERQIDIKNIKVYTTNASGSRLLGNTVDPEIICSMKNAEKYFVNMGMTVEEVKLSSHIDGSLEGSLSNFVEMNDIPDMLIHLDDPKTRDNIAIELLKHLVGLPKYSLAALVFMILKDSGGFMTAENRKRYRQELAVLRQELLDLLGDDGVLLYPTMHCTAFKHHTSYLNMPGVAFTMLFNVIGFPASHIPMGLSKEGLPVGFQVVAAPYQDRLCLAIAEDLEKKFGGWVPPS